MSSVITGKYPNKHGIRNPYSYLIGPSIATILKKYDYKTDGFVGNGLLSKRLGAIQGIGTTVAAYLSYVYTKRVSKHPELYRIRAIPRKVILDFTN